MGKWYSKEANCVSGTGFDVRYIRLAEEKDWLEAKGNFELKNQNNDLFYAAWDNYTANERGSWMDFINEFKRLMTDGPHPYDCKCIIHS